MAFYTVLNNFAVESENRWEVSTPHPVLLLPPLYGWGINFLLGPRVRDIFLQEKKLKLFLTILQIITNKGNQLLESISYLDPSGYTIVN